MKKKSRKNNFFSYSGQSNFQIIFKTIFDLIKFNFKDKLDSKIIVHSPALGLGVYKPAKLNYKEYLDTVKNEIRIFNF